ncbi:DUF4233 domain-containing protein [Microbacterium sp. LRZ72]|uniref:DUF4233 domain-containing protein n=1 Tax=Microbacterium sp. LRZ72 TaxID=2942481 RepID=UPI0029B278BE|nr:DUF4233 domain-containing protein [Microbacterium sp. LRZ72]MDX2375500.1 DUF4233 domain-containing protein [Microbacterium sp. LRZ72]
MSAPRTRRSLTAQLAAIVLVFESVVVFLGGLVAYGLRVLPESVAPWWGIVGGAVLGVVMIATGGVAHTRAGIVIGWALQGLVALSAFLVPGMLLVALVFGGMWAYATIQGPRIERRARDAAPEGE